MMPERPRPSTLTMTIIWNYLPSPSWSWKRSLNSKKYNLATHWSGPNQDPPEFVKTFDREKPRAVWYNTIKALDLDMKLHDAIVDWRSKSAGEIRNSINLKCQSPNNHVLSGNGWSK